MAILFATVLRFVLKRLNDKLDRGMVTDGAAVVDGGRKKGIEEHDLPLAVNRGFRFLL